MKPFAELNDEELLILTQDQIDYFIKLKKAETGIKIIQLPEYPKLQEVPEKDLMVYEVDGYAFTEQDKAEDFAREINGRIMSSVKVNYDYYVGSRDYEYAKPYEGDLVTVKSKRVFSWPVYVSIKNSVASNKKVLEAYEEVKDAYDEEDKKSDEIVEEINSKIAEARQRRNALTNYKGRIAEYLDLAGGNEDIAWNFFDKAYTVSAEVREQIKSSQEYQDKLTSLAK